MARGVQIVAGLGLAVFSSLFTPAGAQPVERADLGSDAFSLGTLSPASGALSRSLWSGSDRDTVAALLDSVPRSYDDPNYLELLRRVTLSPGEGPAGADNALAGAKLLVAAEAGFYEQAASLAMIVPGLRSEPGLSKVVAYAELFDGKMDQACVRGAGLRDGRTDAFWIKLRFVCYVRAGESSAAELTLGLLQRQGVLTEAEEKYFTALSEGKSLTFNAPPADPLFFGLMRDSGGKVPSIEALSDATPAALAAIARDKAQLADVREAALVKSLSLRTIDYREGRGLVETMPTTALAADLLEVATQTRGTLDHGIAIGEVLSRNTGDWDGFTARALLLSQELPVAEPVINVAPHAAEVAIAAMITGQDAVVEKWVLALSQDTEDPTAAQRAADLVALYGIQNPGAARRLGSYIGYSFSPAAVPAYATAPGQGDVDLTRFVNMGLAASNARSEGPAALLFLAGLDVEASDETAPVRDIVVAWARKQAHLEWLDREAAFRSSAVRFLGEPGSGPEMTGGPSIATPSVKPGTN